MSSSSSSTSSSRQKKIKTTSNNGGGGDIPPNILIAGTPGTGKSSLCKRLVEEVPGLTHLDVSELVKNDPSLRHEFDEDSQSYIINEDALVDHLESYMSERGGIVLESHSLLDYFPERWFRLVAVLRTDNTILYDRLARRGYAPKKITENVDCEIARVVLDEALDSYAEGVVHELKSDGVEDLENNVERIVEWLKSL